MAKFKPGDIITPTMTDHGFENAEVLNIFTKKKKEYYRLKISHGIATIPLHAEEAYKLVNSAEDKKKR